MVDGIVAPLPPCYASQWFQNTCEVSSCCRTIGSCGLASCRQRRSNLMVFAAVLSFIALIFQIVPVVATTTNQDTLMNVSWTLGEISKDSTDTDVTIHVGLAGFAHCTTQGDNDEDCGFMKWDHADCNQGYCQDCKDACQATFSVAIIALITSVPQFLTDLQRSTIEGDVNCQKAFGFATGMLGTITTLAAISAFADGCYNSLPDEMYGGTVDWSFGPSFVLLLIATLMKPLDALMHGLLPSPVTKITEEYTSTETWEASADPDYLGEKTASA